jgi:hypothetical protein
VFLDLLERQHHIVRIESLRLSPAMASAGQAVNPHLLGGRLRCHVLAEKND